MHGKHRSMEVLALGLSLSKAQAGPTLGLPQARLLFTVPSTGL